MPKEFAHTRSTSGNSTTEKIRQLNDMFRELPFEQGRLFFTNGVTSLGDDIVRQVMKSVIAYDDFNEGNDPHGEHDFGSFTIKGIKFFWKIDYYDSDMENQSPDPSDPSVTTRVLTIMLAEEY